MATAHYQVLKVAADAPVEVIRAAYRALAARHHPDRCGDDPSAAARMQRVNQAYRVLSDPALRARYDAVLRRERRRRATDVPSTPPLPARRPRIDVDVDGEIDVPPALRRRAAEAYRAHASLGSWRA